MRIYIKSHVTNMSQMAIASNGRYTTKLCERKPEIEIDDANVLAQRDTEPQLSGRRLRAVNGVLEEGYR